MPAPHILAVDDDPAMRELISDLLTESGFRVSTAADGQGMRQCLAHAPVDLVLLDIRLGPEDGMVLVRELRAVAQIPIILLTGRLEEGDRVTGRELGVDDFVTKPFHPRELITRIQAALSRAQPREAASPQPRRALYRFAGWELDRHTGCLRSPGGEPVSLTRGEMSLLAAFLRAPGRVLTRAELLDLIHAHDDEALDPGLDIQILRLRRKMEADPGEPELIKTERDAGYRFAVKVEVL